MPLYASALRHRHPHTTEPRTMAAACVASARIATVAVRAHNCADHASGSSSGAPKSMPITQTRTVARQRAPSSAAAAAAGTDAAENVEQIEVFLDGLKYDDKGLVVAIAQDVDTGAILMQGFADRTAVRTTLTAKKATFFSRSRQQQWTKACTTRCLRSRLDTRCVPSILG